MTRDKHNSMYICYLNIHFVKGNRLENPQFVPFHVKAEKIDLNLANGKKDGIKRKTLHCDICFFVRIVWYSPRCNNVTEIWVMIRRSVYNLI